MNITDIEPTKGHVLVELPPKQTMVGDLVLGETPTANNAPVKGTVIRVPDSGSVFAVGEVVFFRKYAIDELKFSEAGLAEVEVYIIDEREVLGTIRPLSPAVVETPIQEVREATKDADQKLKDSLT